MGRSVLLDAGVQQYAEACVQRRLAAEVGTLVGRCAPGKDLVLQALRAPERDGEQPISVVAASGSASGSKKGNKGAKGATGGGLDLDDEWVVEHAAMVERLLPGGLDVVGLYVLCPAAAFAAASTQLAQLAEAAGKELGARLPSLLVLHIDSVSGALALREAAVRELRPAELRAAPLAEQLVQLQARYALDLRLPVTASKQELAAALQAAADAGAARVRGALGLVGGELAAPDCQVADLSPPPNGVPLPVELLLQPAAALGLSGAGGGKGGSGLARGRAEERALGTVGLQGVLDCRAVVHKREPTTAAVEAIAADVRRSLRARLDALLDAAEQQQEAAAAEAEAAAAAAAAAARGAGGAAAAAPPPPPVHPLFAPAGGASKPLAVSLPRRAFVAAGAGSGVPYCDYLFEGEASQAMLGRLQMLLPFPELAGAAVECLETAAPAAPRPKPAAARSGSGGQGGGGGGAAALPCNLVAAGSIAVGLLALAIGYMSLSG